MPKFVLPDYKNSLLNVPSTILSLFGAQTIHHPLIKNAWQNTEGCKNIVMFLLDGFGFNIYEKFALKNSFFKNFSERGLVSKITSVFPATTAAALTTLHTGLAPIEHGFFEWNLYFPVIEEIIESIPFEVVFSKYTPQNTVLSQNPSLIYSGETIYNKLKTHYIDSLYFTQEKFVNDTFTKAVSKGAKVVGFSSLSDLFIKLTSFLENSPSRLYCYIYLGEVDTAEHHYGVSSNEVKNAIDSLSKHFEENFLKPLSMKTARQTGILFTADHGHENIDVKNITLLNNYNFLDKTYQKTSHKTPILPSGSPRDIFLHVKDEKINEVISFLTKKLGNNSMVIKLEQSTIDKLFGKFPPHNEFLERLGNILILSNTSHVCWYEYNSQKQLTHKSHHGSLLESEMIIPFGSIKVSDLL